MRIFILHHLCAKSELFSRIQSTTENVLRHRLTADRLYSPHMNQFTPPSRKPRFAIITFCILLCVLIGDAVTAQTNSSARSDYRCLKAPMLPPVNETDPGKSVLEVNSDAELRGIIGNLPANTVILIAPGTYSLPQTISIEQNNVTIRGNSNRCDEVRLVGMGMDNADGASRVPHGILINARNTKIQNLTIEQIYHHPISIGPRAVAPEIYNVQLLDAGEQFIKVNSAESTSGVRNGRVEYTIMKYTNSTPSADRGAGVGLIQGINIHSGNNWLIRHNRFENLHTPDSADWLLNSAIVVWSLSSDTIVENNVFINVDRAVAFGLSERQDEHMRGIIRNNMIVMNENLFSEEKRREADAPIILWNAPSAQVLHNSILTNGNTPSSIELRYNSEDVIIRNNLVDAPIRDRSENNYVDTDNTIIKDRTRFVDPDAGDLHLRSSTVGSARSVPTIRNALQDIDGQIRKTNSTDAGADEFRP